MQDPSFGVAQQLLPHVHLTSSYRFPFHATFSPENALEYLLSAPRIVKDVASVGWTYFQLPPQDGAVFLVWQSPQRPQVYASDGYCWADPEMQYKVELRGYTLEVLIHQSGFRPQVETVSTHSRKRYRIINRNPAIPNLQPFDHTLWVVHYSAAEPGYRYPVNRLQISPDQQRSMNERRFIESQGQLHRKEFMLHDRHNWPTINFMPAGHMASGYPQAGGVYNVVHMQQMTAMGRHQQYYQQGQAAIIGQPPAKRPRQAPPPHMASGAGVSMSPIPGGIPIGDTSIEDEENTAIGDALDHLTPRDISVMRYQQHHLWMEEILSSPYSAGQIMPVDLGFGLTGELAALTDGLFDTPGVRDFSDPYNPKESTPRNFKDYEKPDSAKLEAFQRRVDEYLRKGEAELEKMRSLHSRKMADLKRSKSWVQAERRLKDVYDSGRIRGDHSQDPSGHTGVSSLKEKTSQIAGEVEASLGVKISTREEVTCVEKGGLIEDVVGQVNGNGSSNGLLDDANMDADNTAAGLLDQFTSNSLVSTPANLAVPQISQPASQMNSTVATPSAMANDTARNSSYHGHSTLQTSNDAQDSSNLNLMEDMDLDVDMSGMTSAEGDKSTENEWVMIDQPSSTQTCNTESIPQQNQLQTRTAVQDTAAMSSTAHQTDNTDNMFDTAGFGDFANLDTAGDALEDYTNADDDLGLDLVNDSAFGDAFHGTETHNHSDMDGGSS